MYIIDMNRSLQFINKMKLLWRVKKFHKKSYSYPSVMTFSTISSSTSGHHCGVTVFRDVRYSDSHERNVMDIYQPSSVEVPRDNDQYAFIYIHGGMWLPGSKIIYGMN